MAKKTYTLSEYLEECRRKETKKNTNININNKDTNEKFSKKQKIDSKKNINLDLINKNEKKVIPSEINPKTNNQIINKIDEDIKKNERQSFTEKIKTIREKVREYSKLEKEIGKLTNMWKEIMGQTNTYNQQYHTFTLGHIKKEESFGWSCRIYTPYGLTFNELEKLKPIIEDNLSCMFFYQQKKCQNFVMAKFVMDGFKSMEFTIPKTKPFEVYIGNGIDGKPTIVDLRKYPHIMLSGANGSGKSRLLDCMLTTLICNCDEKELSLYLVQVAKNDLIIYEDAVQCRAFCDDLEKTNIMLENIMEIMDKRTILIKPLRKKGLGSDISDYNRLNAQNKMPVVMVIFDEYASITDSSNDNKKIKELKQQIIGKVERIAQYGRALGCFLGVCLQRPVAQMLSPFVKSQSNLRISGKQNNQKSSEVAMDDPYVALNLEERVFVYKTFDYDYIKTPHIDDKIILNSIKPSLKPNHRNLFDDLKKLNKSDKDISINNSNIDSKNKETVEVGKGVVELPSVQNPKNIPISNNCNSTKDTLDNNVVLDKDIVVDKIEEQQNTNSNNKENQEVIEIKEENISQQNLGESIIKEKEDIKKIETKTNIEQKVQSVEKINLTTKIQLEFNNVDPIVINKKQEKLKGNISKIPSFVPFNPNLNNLNIIDKTKIDLSEKSTKKKEKYEKGIVILDDNENLHNS